MSVPIRLQVRVNLCLHQIRTRTKHFRHNELYAYGRYVLRFLNFDTGITFLIEDIINFIINCITIYESILPPS